jgi:hypothetical protein
MQHFYVAQQARDQPKAKEANETCLLQSLDNWQASHPQHMASLNVQLIKLYRHMAGLPTSACQLVTN